MTAEIEIPELPELPKTDELTALKARADILGVSYGPNIGVELLRQRIQSKLDSDEAAADASDVEDAADDEGFVEVTPKAAEPTRRLTEGEKKAQIRRQMYLDHMYLVRCRIVCLNPDKKELKGEIFTVQNKFLGKVSKYIPFGEETDEGYHIPKILYDNLLERKFVQLRVKKSQDKREMLPEQRWVREFAIEVLPDLTPEERRVLANKQAAAEGMAV